MSPSDARLNVHKNLIKIGAPHALSVARRPARHLPARAFASRSLALWRCMAAAEGAEPTEPPLLRPADDYKLRYRPGRGPPPPPPPPPQAGAGDAEGNVR